MSDTGPQVAPSDVRLAAEAGEEGKLMGFLRRGRQKPGTVRQAESADVRYLQEWITSRSGIEGFIEPRTTVTDTTMLLVALTGEWTRRRVPSAEWAHDFCNRNAIPSYDAAVVGVPDRMREWNKNHKGP